MAMVKSNAEREATRLATSVKRKASSIELTVGEVERRVEDIVDTAYGRSAEDNPDGAEDPAAAHFLEDRLFHDVLKAVAAGSPDSQALAAAACKSKTRTWRRWGN